MCVATGVPVPSVWKLVCLWRVWGNWVCLRRVCGNWCACTECAAITGGVPLPSVQELGVLCRVRGNGCACTERTATKCACAECVVSGVTVPTMWQPVYFCRVRDDRYTWLNVLRLMCLCQVCDNWCDCAKCVTTGFLVLSV